MEVCEVRAAEGALSPPTTSEKAQRSTSPDEDPVLGWRRGGPSWFPTPNGCWKRSWAKAVSGRCGWLGRHQKLKERRVFKFCFRADRVRSLKREMTLFRVLKERVGDHPNIVAFQEVYFDEPPFYMVMDYVEGGDLPIGARNRRRRESPVGDQAGDGGAGGRRLAGGPRRRSHPPGRQAGEHFGFKSEIRNPKSTEI